MKKIGKKIVVGLLIIVLIIVNVWFQDYKKGLMTENVITQPAGHLIEDRSDHHAVLLNDGRIYIVGGDHKTNKSAEIYDPKTKKSKRVADLPEPLLKQEYSVTVLNNGKVLISGGRKDIPGNSKIPIYYSKTAYVYNPVNNIFEPALSMTDTHMEHKAVLLDNGDVIVTGGNRSSIVDMYNPNTNKFTSFGKYCSPSELKKIKYVDLARQGAIKLNNGKVLVLGGAGCDNTDDYSAQAKIIDTKNGKIFQTASLRVNRGYPTLTLLKDGRVLVSGGFNMKDAHLKDLEIYDPQKGVFVDGGKTDERVGYTATLLPNGKVLFAGGGAGYGQAGYGIGSMYVYDPNTQSYTFLGNMKRKRAGHTATVLKDGSIVFIGGSGHREIEIYKPTGNE